MIQSTDRLRFCVAMLACLVVTGVGAVGASAQDLRALARFLSERSSVTDQGSGVAVELSISQAVPYRIQPLASPARIAVDFREVAFGRDIAALTPTDRITRVTAGKIAQGWSRMVLYLDAPMLVDRAGMRTDPVDGDALIRLDLVPATPEAFAQAVAASAGMNRQLGDIEQVAQTTTKTRPIIVLDPGHGGVDPGAQRDGYDEADLMLTFARKLRELLIRSGRYDVVLTRESDVFVSLPARVSIARAAEADLFLSLHADAIAKGRATGTTIYTLSEDASDEASALLAERQNRADIVAGVDLSAKDDEIARVLIDLARQETTPRTDLLADYLVEDLQKTLGKLHKRPRLRASFSVLKAPDIPSVLVELGFMSSQSDLENLMDPDWRAKAAEGILAAIDRWMIEDAARREAGQ